MRIYAKQMMTPRGILKHHIVEIKDSMIHDIFPDSGLHSYDLQADILTPGLIDLHVHGGQGFNARDFDLDQISPFLDAMLADGVTDFLMTISTGFKDTMCHGLEVTRQAMQLQHEGKLGGARILGAHLEGPFLSAYRPGAMQTDAIIPPDIDAYEGMFDGYEDTIRLISLAPEVPGADLLIQHLCKKGIAVQAGHTNATYEEAMRAFSGGISSLCHTFNACRPIHHRDPGVITAALVNPDVYCEAICDLEHLHGGSLKLIYGMKGPDRMVLVSDSVATHGMPDGEYFMEGYHIVVKDGVSHTAEGTLDGGGVYLGGALRNVIFLGIPVCNAVSMATSTPAARMGFTDIGAIEVGKRANLTAWNDSWKTEFSIVSY